MRNMIRYMIPLFGVAIMVNAITAMNPVLATIAQAFPNEPMAAVQMIVTIPAICAVPIELLTGVLVSYLPKKRILQYSLIMVLIGGSLPLLIHDNFAVLLVSSAIIGLGGFNIAISTSMIGHLFEGSARSTMFGWTSAMQSIGVSVLVMFAGFLGTIHFWYAYGIFLLSLPVLILVTAFLPLDEKEQKLVGHGVGLTGLKNLLTPGLVFMCCIAIAAACAQQGFMQNVSFLVAQKGMGDSADAGVATSFINISMFFVGLVFGLIAKVFKKFTLPVAYLLAALSFAMMFLATDVIGVSAAAIVFGISFGMQIPSGYAYTSEAVKQNTLTMAMALYGCCINVGMSIAPVTINALAGGRGDAQANFVVGGVIFLVLFVVVLIREIFFHHDSMIGMKAPQRGAARKDVARMAEEGEDDEL